MRLFFQTALIIALVVVVGSQTANSQDIIQYAKNFKRHVKNRVQARLGEPALHEDDAIERLACEIDWLEDHLDLYGSIVTKQPDIWGESRLTKFRRDVEEQLSERKDQFQLRDNASIVRTDIVQLASAISIGKIAQSPSPAVVPSPTPVVVSPPPASSNASVSLTLDGLSLNAVGPGTSESDDDDASSTPPPVPTAAPSPTNPALPQFNALTTPTSPDAYTASKNIEPIIELNQLNRYLNHLNQLRRVNDGDDTSDSPGYALNLVRIPVSILPGRATRRGYGAEVTVSANLAMRPTLLPSTFRNLVVNDLVDQLSLPVLRLAEQRNAAVVSTISSNQQLAENIQNAFVSFEASKKGNADLKKFLAQSAGFSSELPSNDEIDSAFAILKAFAKKLVKALEQAGDKETAEKLGELIVTVHEEVGVQQQLDDPDFQMSKAKVQSKKDRMIAYFKNELDSRGTTYYESLARSNAKFVGGQMESIEFLELSKGLVSLRDGLSPAELSEASSVLTQMSTIRNLWDEKVQQKNSTTGENDPTRLESVIGTKDDSDELDIQINSLAKAFMVETDKFKMIEAVGSARETQKKDTNENLEKIVKAVASVSASVSTLSGVSSLIQVRRSKFPMSPSIVLDVYSEQFLADFAIQLRQSYKGRYVVWNESSDYKNQIHLVDVQKFLSENLASAYDAFSQSGGRELLIDSIRNQKLAEAIKVGNIQQVESIRNSFFLNAQNRQMDDQLVKYCWCLTVEMALLNERLKEDVRRQAIQKPEEGCDCRCDAMFYLPLPTCDLSTIEGADPDFWHASKQFNNYVNSRWPIHVFTIDPINQEQNISEASTVQQELSIAAALSFVQGNIRLEQLNRFQRQFQENISTVSLNRTQVGFVHKHDTFGWRFSPRVQPRQSRSNLKAFAETAFGRRSDANWNEAILEPGIRECTAIVLMPSFVPYCDFDVRTNWFQLARPTHTDMTMKETMKLSRTVTKMRAARSRCVECSHLYRPGDLERMFRRVEQLERELPLQTLTSQIPYENTLGGFELFNDGLTDLGPELTGWYGAPGVAIGYTSTEEDKKKRLRKQADSTRLFLVGDNLSVHETRVIAGGLEVVDAKKRIVSRQVLEVEVPDTAQTVEIEGRKYVAIYASTPYGVTGHLHIPVVSNVSGQDASLEEVKKELIAKIEGDRFQWKKSTDLLWEFGIFRENSTCMVAPTRLLDGDVGFELGSSSLLDRVGHDRSFSLIGLLKRKVNGKDVEVGSPFFVGVERVKDAATDKVDDVPRKWDMGSTVSLSRDMLFNTSHFKDVLKSAVSASMFDKDNSLDLTLETYVAVVDKKGGYEEPILVKEKLKLKLALSEQVCNDGSLPIQQPGEGEAMLRRSINTPAFETERLRFESGQMLPAGRRRPVSSRRASLPGTVNR